ncbi:MAG TPA: hypothetical protein VEJ19_00870 [Nitrososphaerales archaeon]|nr:hypothetical protein [Nitrososphaerales archaeon]
MRNGAIASLLVVALIVGVAFGTVFFPRTLTLSSTQTTTKTTTLLSLQTTTLTLVSNNQSYPVVTVTRITVLVYPVVATCTTVSGTRSVVYTYASGGQTTSVTTIYPSDLPQQYLVTVVTASTVSGVNQTYVQVPDIC